MHEYLRHWSWILLLVAIARAVLYFLRRGKSSKPLAADVQVQTSRAIGPIRVESEIGVVNVRGIVLVRRGGIPDEAMQLLVETAREILPGASNLVLAGLSRDSDLLESIQQATSLAASLRRAIHSSKYRELLADTTTADYGFDLVVDNIEDRRACALLEARLRRMNSERAEDRSFGGGLEATMLGLALEAAYAGDFSLIEKYLRKMREEAEPQDRLALDSVLYYLHRVVVATEALRMALVNRHQELGNMPSEPELAAAELLRLTEVMKEMGDGNIRPALDYVRGLSPEELGPYLRLLEMQERLGLAAA